MKFSIVIATLNGAETLSGALDSVFTQTYPKWEVVVQDGGSTDSTLDILKHCDARVNWRSEPDTGVYDAWNKAARRVTGDWALFLGADDCLVHKNALAQSFRHLATLPEAVQFAYGALLLDERKNGKNLAVNRSLRAVYHNFLLNMSLAFPSTFVRTSLLREQRFDTGYAIAGDYAFAARHITRANVARLPVWVSFMRRGGISDRPETDEALLAERLRVLRECIAPRAEEFVLAIAEHVRDTDLGLEDIPEE